MKKIISILLAVIMASVLFTGCQKDSADGKFKIGIVQIMEHTSLNMIRETMIEELKALGLDESKVEFEYQDAANEQANLNTICQSFVSDKKDVIVAIATPSAQAAANATSEIPIVFSAITDPVGAGLMTDITKPDGNITGTSDFVDAEKILEMAIKLTPEAKTYGLIYSTSEPNSKTVIEKAKNYLKSRNLEYVETAVTNSSEIQQVGTSLADKVDAMFAPIDNTIAMSMGVLAPICTEKKIPFYVAADSMVADGGFATEGLDYKDLGKKTAELVKQIYDGKKVSELPVIVFEETKTYINKTVAKQIGITIPEEIAASAEFFE